MATKLKNDFWSVLAVIIALLSLLYCSAFIAETIFGFPAADLLVSLRSPSKGDI